MKNHLSDRMYISPVKLQKKGHHQEGVWAHDEVRITGN